jgi:MarR family transcriptional regulator, 2-MHQ and catechol-resistance regulon repressor
MPTKRTASAVVDTSGVHLWLVLWKVTRVLESHGHRSIAGLNMGLSDFGVLEALLHNGPLPIKDLGAKVLLTSGSITTAVDRLEAKGMVGRFNDKQDRRSRIVRLTAPGRRVIQKAFAEHKIAMETAASGLDVKDRAVLIELLRRLGQDAAKQLAEDKRGISAARRNEEKTWQ